MVGERVATSRAPLIHFAHPTTKRAKARMQRAAATRVIQSV